MERNAVIIFHSQPHFKKFFIAVIRAGRGKSIRQTTPGCDDVREIVTYLHNQALLGRPSKRIDGRSGDLSIFHIIAYAFFLIFGDDVKDDSIFLCYVIVQWSAGYLPVVFVCGNVSGILGAFHAVDRRQSHAIRIVVAVRCLAGEVDRERNLLRFNQWQRIKNASEIEGMSKSRVDIECL